MKTIIKAIIAVMIVFGLSMPSMAAFERYGDWIKSDTFYVNANDISGIWQTGAYNYCVSPQCVGSVLVANNTINFSLYPTRNLCKNIGGRLPTITEFIEINTNNASLGYFNGTYYWTANEQSNAGAYYRTIPGGGGDANLKDSGGYRGKCIASFDTTMILSNKYPSSDPITTDGESQTFSFDTNQTANVTWYLNSTLIQTNLSTWTANYKNQSGAIGYWNVTAIATSINGSFVEDYIWNWTVNAIPTGIIPINKTPMATTVWINWSSTFTQANNSIEYSTDSGLAVPSFSYWKNNTITPQIKLWNLTPLTTYYYNVTSYNASNNSQTENSSIFSFTTPASVTYKIVNSSDGNLSGIDNTAQEAIDMLSISGGTINMTAGTYEFPYRQMRVDHKNNVSIYGYGVSTILNGTYAGIDVNNNRNYHHHDYLRGDDSVYPFLDPISALGNYYPTIRENISISNLSYTTSDGGLGGGISFKNIHGGNIINTYGHDIDSGGIGLMGSKSNDAPPHIYTTDITINNNTILNSHSGLNTIYANSNTITSNNVTNVHGWVCFQLNSGSSYNNISNNIFVNCQNHGLEMYSSSNYNTINNNTINLTQGNGIDTYVSWGNNITNNRISFFRDNGIAEYYGGANNITNNIVFNGTGTQFALGENYLGSGISIYVDGNYNNSTIVGNTIINNPGHGIHISKVNTSGFIVNNLTIKNNIIVNNSKYGISMLNSSPYITNYIVDYNNVWNNGFGDYNQTFTISNSISSNPLFVSSIDSHLQGNQTWNGTAWVHYGTDSPAIGAGDPTSDNSLSPWYPTQTRIEMGAYGNTIYASQGTTIITYNISGYVNDTLGSAIDSVSVVNGTNSTTTNATGYYNLSLMTNGTYNFSYTKAGFDTNYKNITIDGADVINQNVTLSDTTPPGQVTGMTNDTPTTSTVNISWTTVDGANYYQIFRDNVSQGYTQNIYYNDTGLSSYTTYQYIARANDTYNNWGLNSSTLSIITLGNQPNITSWSNNYTNNNTLSFTVPQNTNVTFNATANQTLTICSWTDATQINCTADTYAYKLFSTLGINYANLSASNANGSTLNSVNWTIAVEAPPPDTSFTITLPSGQTQAFFNATSKSSTNVNASGQNATVGFLYVTNTGNVALDFYSIVTSAQPTGVILKSDIDNNPTGATTITTSLTQVISALGTSNSQYVWLWVDYSNALPMTEQRTLSVNSSQS